MTDRDERVLQRRTGARVRMDVAGRDAAQLQLARKRGEAPVARAIVAQVGALQLDAQALGAEGVAQRFEARPVVDAMGGAAAEADEPVGAIEHGRERDVRLSRLARAHAGSGPPARSRLPLRVPPCGVPRRVRRSRRPVPARVSVRARQQPAEVAPSALVLDEQRQVAAVVERQLGAVQRAQPNRLGRLGVLHRAADVVVVGQRERLVPQLARRDGLFVRQRSAVEEREGGVRVQLDIGHEHMFASHIYVGYRREVDPPIAGGRARQFQRCTNQPPSRRSWNATRLRPQVVTTSQ